MSHAASDRDVVVLYVAGEGRSGSTVLATMLGNNRGYFPVGELRGVWQAVRSDELCGCGDRFSQCPFWTAVGRRAFDGWGQVDVNAVLEADAALARHRNLPRVALSRPGSDRHHQLQEHRGRLSSLYAAIAETADCDVIVDSTKDPAYAYLLRGVPSVDLRLIHLVRDSRGVVYSWMKKNVPRPEYAEDDQLKDTYMDSRGALEAGIEWTAKNILLHLFHGTPRLLMRYEDLVAAPEEELLRVQELAGSGSWVRGEMSFPLEAKPFHSLGGNRVRFERGPIQSRLDVDWRTSMRASDRAVALASTFPLLLSYGYLTRRD